MTQEKKQLYAIQVQDGAFKGWYMDFTEGRWTFRQEFKDAFVHDNLQYLAQIIEHIKDRGLKYTIEIAPPPTVSYLAFHEITKPSPPGRRFSSVDNFIKWISGLWKPKTKPSQDGE